MRRRVLAILAILVTTSLTVSLGFAQPAVFIGAGPTFPVGDFGDYAKTGWLATAGVAVPVGPKGVYLGGEFAYGSNKHSDLTGDKTNLTGIFGFVEYRTGDPAKPGVYLLGEVGILNHQFKPAGTMGYGGLSDWKAAVGGGVGVDIPVGGASLFIETRVIARSSTAFVPLLAGVAFPVGKKK